MNDHSHQSVHLQELCCLLDPSLLVPSTQTIKYSTTIFKHLNGQLFTMNACIYCATQNRSKSRTSKVISIVEHDQCCIKQKYLVQHNINKQHEML